MSEERPLPNKPITEMTLLTMGWEEAYDEDEDEDEY